MFLRCAKRFDIAFIYISRLKRRRKRWVIVMKAMIVKRLKLIYDDCCTFNYVQGVCSLLCF